MSAHPPCSRKGPLLPACGLKCPRRVKRETTNSRFFRFKGTLPNFWWSTPHESNSRGLIGRRQSKSSLNRVALERKALNAPQSALKDDPFRSVPQLAIVAQRRQTESPDPPRRFPKTLVACPPPWSLGVLANGGLRFWCAVGRCLSPGPARTDLEGGNKTLRP